MANPARIGSASDQQSDRQHHQLCGDDAGRHHGGRLLRIGGGQLLSHQRQQRAIDAWYWRIGMVHLLQSHTDEAIRWLEKARSANPARPGPHAYLASAYALKGEADRAASELAEARRLVRGNLYSSITSLKATIPFGVPKIRALFEATYLAGLRKAGVPEE
jgi:hypothetical protein